MSILVCLHVRISLHVCHVHVFIDSLHVVTYVDVECAILEVCLLGSVGRNVVVRSWPLEECVDECASSVRSSGLLKECMEHSSIYPLQEAYS